MHRDFLNFKLLLVSGITDSLFFNEYLTILLVIALLAEHSFWFSGKDMEAQLPHAIKSFKSQKCITINILEAEVETAYNNASDKEDSAWLIQWVIGHKLVCNIIFNFLVHVLIY
jgi:hypothetical protein